MNNGVFCSAYFPPISYFKALAQCGKAYMEGEESYCKQSYRNRCKILSANGILPLTIPVCKGKDGSIRSVTIDYSKPWLREHKRAMEAAYRSSPFFEYYCDDIFTILDNGTERLFDLNMALTEKIARFCGLKTVFDITDVYVRDYSLTGPGSDIITDYRKVFDPKKQQLPENLRTAAYYQVFSEKFGFTEDLSILDLLFNEGPNSITYL